MKIIVVILHFNEIISINRDLNSINVSLIPRKVAKPAEGRRSYWWYQKLETSIFDDSTIAFAQVGLTANHVRFFFRKIQNMYVFLLDI